jgi:tetratricopeptide (TPR) repeat protein
MEKNMFQLKSLAREAIPKALQKAERYRLLNEPWDAESICQDVLQIDPDNQEALVVLLLSITDQFDTGATMNHAKEALKGIRDEYQKSYYAGIISERFAKRQLDHGGPGSGYVAYDWLENAMKWYEKAESLRPDGNDDALLRWNSCARLIMQHNLVPDPEERSELPLE